ncbi:MAG TPA: hypothetical protein VFC71_05400 [Candidatus Polarisedimenticolia bacterium]|nr:hypothetical protein [Candidatus Polarisedimenticolia bacterium]
MTSDRRFEQDLPELLAQLAYGSTPEYRDHVVQETARMRQRPAWTFPERWIPMSTITARLAPLPRLPWRTIGLVALLLAALVVGALLSAGRNDGLPSPFGRAANGSVAYSADGDIYTVDPASGSARAVVTGSATDVGPVWSRDGTHLAFFREKTGNPGTGRLYVGRADGSGVIAVTPKLVVNVSHYSFSPDGRHIVYLEEVRDGQRTMWVANVDGSGALPFDLDGMEADWPAYRPDGSEILFAGGEALSGLGNGIYAVNVASGVVRMIVAPSANPSLETLSWSPDGSQIAYVEWNPQEGGPCSKVVHVVAADGSGDRRLPVPAGTTCQEPVAWSNDGTRVVVVRNLAGSDLAVFAIVPADGSGVGLDTTGLTKKIEGLGGLSGVTGEWAPDDTAILVTPTGAGDSPLPQLLIDPLTGASRPAPWAATSQPTWQRLAP